MVSVNEILSESFVSNVTAIDLPVELHQRRGPLGLVSGCDEGGIGGHHREDTTSVCLDDVTVKRSTGKENRRSDDDGPKRVGA